MTCPAPQIASCQVVVGQVVLSVELLYVCLLHNQRQPAFFLGSYLSSRSRGGLYKAFSLVWY